LPALLIAISVGLVERRDSWATAALAVVLMVSVVSTVKTRIDPRYARADYRGAVEYVRDVAESDDRVIVSSRFTIGAVRYYFGSERAIEKLEFRPIRTPETAEDAFDSLVGDDLAPAPRTWLIMSRQWEEDPSSYLRDRLDRSEKVVLAHSLPGVDVYRIADSSLARRPM